MSAAVVAVNGPDGPDRLLVRVHLGDPRFADRAGDVIAHCWHVVLREPRGLALVSAPPEFAVNRYPAGYANAWCGPGVLAWYTDPVTNGPASGLCPHDMTAEVFDPFAVRGLFVDTNYNLTWESMAEALGHEIFHLAGVGRTRHDDSTGPHRFRLLAAGLAMAAAAARKWRAD